MCVINQKYDRGRRLMLKYVFCFMETTHEPLHIFKLRLV
jgi:hypothetical protein